MSKSKSAGAKERFIVRHDGHVAWILFNRPDRLNAMTIDSWGELCDHITALDKERDIRCLVIAGEGRAFLAGHDVAEIKEHNEDMVAGKLTASQLREWQKNLQNSTKVIRAARFPVDETTKQLGDRRAFRVEVEVGDEQRGHRRSVIRGTTATTCGHVGAARVAGRPR